MHRETYARSLAKTISWRFFATLITSVIVYAFTGRLLLALTVGGIEVVTKILAYFVHERLWDNLHFGRVEIEPAVIWLTGFSGSGKSTIAARLSEELARLKYHVERLDGDAMRKLFPNIGFTRAERDDHIKRMGVLAGRLEKNGVFVVASFVSPYRESRDFVRQHCKRMLEVHVSTPLEECERRDPKGLYAKARRGELKSFTGVDDPYEAPLKPELSVDTRTTDADAAVKLILKMLGV